MLRIAACDGDPPYLAELERLIFTWERARNLNLAFLPCESPADVMADIELHGHIDLVFLDLPPDSTEESLVAASRLKAEDEAVEIAFVSTLNLFGRELFTLRPLGVLTNPLSSGALHELLERCLMLRCDRKFLFRSRQRIVALYADKIIYVFHRRRILSIYYLDGRKFETYMRLDEAEELLKDSDAAFWRAHYSCLVNVRYVEQVKRGLIILDNGQPISVSRPYVSALFSYFEQYHRMQKKGKSVQKNG